MGILEDPLIHHLFVSRVLFIGLKNEFDIPFNFIFMPGQYLRGDQKHGGMAVMAACMHFAIIDRRIRQIVLFLDGKSIHISAEQDCPPGVPPPSRPATPVCAIFVLTSSPHSLRYFSTIPEVLIS